MKIFHSRTVKLIAGSLLMSTIAAQAAVVPDRTRVIFRGDQKSVSITLRNDNQSLPYLAQAWIETSTGQKITSPLTVLPPVQRIEPTATGQVKVQGMPGLASLPQDRETMFYFNIREIPPKSSKPNVLQIALQTRIKLFYRPAALPALDPQHPWQHQLTLTRTSDSYTVKNPTPYFVITSSAGPSKDKTAAGFEPIILAPFASQPLKVKSADLGSEPVLGYVNDYGGRPSLYFTCAANTCSVNEEKSLKK
ncbi:TPA: fimbria/pilus periplasmic chaperone [Enterobacter cancerogenus]|nr:fimbria/pilus periplasmic chaperone [Enterobacter cancerogenus]HBI6867084.1 fimbria/pilus periplasmic chaperone [Enterobacter cancerogenus]